MKYPSLKPQKELEHRISSFSGGINCYGTPDSVGENELTECENMWFNNGTLETRPGFTTSSNDIFYCDEGMVTSSLPFKITDTSIYISGIRYRVAYIGETNSTTYDNIYVYFIPDEGEMISAGVIHFNRISIDYFYHPQRVFFSVAAKTLGGGLYAYICVTDEAGLKSYRIYEINESFTDWSQLSDDDFYIPTVYMNGRGNKYEDIIEQPLTFKGEPCFPESFNMLTGRFKAYFTSDSNSTSFTLPFINLDDRHISCDYYLGNTHVRWNIQSGETSASASFMSATIVLTCNRSTGVMSFSYPDGTAYPVPRNPDLIQNNLCFTAYKTKPDNLKSIVTSKYARSFNNMTFLCGNEVKGNEVYCSYFSSPLYFSEKRIISVGTDLGAVNALAVQNNRLIAFKSNSVYRIDVERQTVSRPEYLLVDNDNLFLYDEDISAQPVHPHIGCDCPETVQLCGNRLVWLNSSGTVYTLISTAYVSDNYINKLSSVIDKKLTEIARSDMYSAFAVNNNGYYLLFIGDKIYAMDYRVKGFGYSSSYTGIRESKGGVAWYIWSKSENVYYNSGFSFAGKLTLVSIGPNEKIQYFSHLKSGKDANFTLNSHGVPVYNEVEISSRLSTAVTYFGLPEVKKSINEIFVVGKSDLPVNITVNTDISSNSRTVSRKRFSQGTVRILPFMRAASGVRLNFDTKGHFEISEIVFRYKKITDAR